MLVVLPRPAPPPWLLAGWRIRQEEGGGGSSPTGRGGGARAAAADSTLLSAIRVLRKSGTSMEHGGHALVVVWAPAVAKKQPSKENNTKNQGGESRQAGAAARMIGSNLG